MVKGIKDFINTALLGSERVSISAGTDMTFRLK
jgi:hypothetical protein